jgi:hypothetical protein
MTTTIKNSDGFDAATHYGKPLETHAVTSFGGASVRDYKNIDLSTDFRTVLVHCFDISFWAVAPTVENAITWLHGKSYASDLLLNKMRDMTECSQTHEEAAKEHADDVVRWTEWEVLTNDEGMTIVRGWYREDLS